MERRRRPCPFRSSNRLTSPEARRRSSWSIPTPFRRTQSRFQYTDLIAKRSGFFVIFRSERRLQQAAFGLQVRANARTRIVQARHLPAVRQRDVNAFEQGLKLRGKSRVTRAATDAAGLDDLLECRAARSTGLARFRRV